MIVVRTERRRRAGPLNLLERMTAWVHRNTLVRAGTDEWRHSFPTIGFKPENVFVVPVSIRDDWTGASHTPASEPTILWLGKRADHACALHARMATFASAGVPENVP